MNTRHAVVVTIFIHAALMLGAYAGLLVFFDFPEILREPVEVYLKRFQENESIIVFCYTAFTWSQVAFAVVAVVMRERFGETSTAWLRAGTSLGVIAGFAQAIGFSRWAFVVPELARSIHVTPESTLLVLDVMHRFAGVAVGEHLFFCFEALWVGALGMHLWIRPESSHVSRKGVLLLFPIAGLIALYTLEQFGGVFAVLGPINVTAHGALLFWLIGFAIRQAFDRPLYGWEVGGLVGVCAALVMPSFF